eukprot:TRINITY_DN9097_c0_g5_i1.p1 TRINITY_DN9097_c0_g5~~TRINITY_DN9097_c0_g5_i1.p1  ORF type:complete len:656 (-),score=71.90 TRINITY_DN9097_c0_g5_i1:273-2150(-)
MAALSHVGKTVCEAMRASHPDCEGKCWNVSLGSYKETLQTPPSMYCHESKLGHEQETTHSDYLPQRMRECIARAEEFFDLTSLCPPDGKFLQAIADGLQSLHQKNKQIIVRILLSNVPGTPTDERAVLAGIAENIPRDSKLCIWVAAYREGASSWNHSKIIACDGKHLIAGGHNLCDAHYLQKDPVRDLTAEYSGHVAADGHEFANALWDHVISEMKRDMHLVDVVPIARNRTGLTRYPDTAAEFPPMYKRACSSADGAGGEIGSGEGGPCGDIPLISLGRYGSLFNNEKNAADAGILAMFRAAKVSIKCSIQDLGSICVEWPPRTGRFVHLPGLSWPKGYLSEIAKAVYERGVTVQIMLSSPHSVPGGISASEAFYGNGWTCQHVADRIAKAIYRTIPGADPQSIISCGERLQICYMRGSGGPCDYHAQNGKVGNHAKNVIVDDTAYIIGSQNLYVCNLAEWGIIVDNKEQCGKFLEEYWQPLWKVSFEAERDLSWKEAVNHTPGGCENHKLPNSSGAFSNCKGPFAECPKCNMYFCNHHRKVNMSDGLLSFGGHVCCAEKSCEISKLANGSSSFSDCEGPCFPCEHCKTVLCKHHHRVNKSEDGLSNSDGHACPAKLAPGAQK